VGFDDDPSGGVKRLRLAEGLIVNAKNEYNARAQDTILTGSFILPKFPTKRSKRLQHSPCPCGHMFLI